jgi:hypothetical protein
VWLLERSTLPRLRPKRPKRDIIRIEDEKVGSPLGGGAGPVDWPSLTAAVEASPGFRAHVFSLGFDSKALARRWNQDAENLFIDAVGRFVGRSC